MPPNATSETSRESLYAILNLPVSASQDDIRHRHKELAVIFHPDKQSNKDERTMRTAEKRFREIQRAYEILIDPDQRQIYDALGEAGLNARRALGHRYSSPDELRAELERLVAEARKGSGRGGFLTSRGELTCAFDAANAFGRDHKPGLGGLSTRLAGVTTNYLGVQHTMEVVLNNTTKASLSGRLGAVPLPQAPRDYGNMVGTIKHQFSPRIQFEATANLLRSRAVNLKTTYHDGESIVFIRTTLSKKTSLLPPPVTLQFNRILFPKSPTEGIVVFHTFPPTFSVSVASPLRPQGAFTWTAGLQLARFSALSAEVATGKLPGGFQAKFGTELGSTGLTGTVTGVWSDEEDSQISVAVGAGGGVVFMRINLEWLGQRIHVPVVLSHELDEMIGMTALLLPAGLAVLAHNFVIKPRIRARRISQLHATRKAYHNAIREYQEEARETTDLLFEGAHRRAEQERAIDGLVILSATYIASGDDGESPISIDVTIPLQAQVHNSQLVIPGGRTKAGLLGFYDPSPGARKRLKIEYLFHGRLHIAADVGDFSQVFLPLRAHVVE